MKQRKHEGDNAENPNDSDYQTECFQFIECFKSWQEKNGFKSWEGDRIGRALFSAFHGRIVRKRIVDNQNRKYVYSGIKLSTPLNPRNPPIPYSSSIYRESIGTSRESRDQGGVNKGFLQIVKDKLNHQAVDIDTFRKENFPDLPLENFDIYLSKAKQEGIIYENPAGYIQKL